MSRDESSGSGRERRCTRSCSPANEARHAVRLGDDYCATYPSFPFWEADFPPGAELPLGFRYASDTNDRWIDIDQLRSMAEAIAAVD